MDWAQMVTTQVFIALLTGVGIFHAPIPDTPPTLPTPTKAIQKPLPSSTLTPIESRLTPTPEAGKSATPTFTPSPTPTVSVPTPTNIPVYRPDKNKLTPTPIRIEDPPATIQTNNQSPITNNSVGFTCNCAKTCGNMSSCAEAQFQLNNCGCAARDADDDGVACDAQCQ